MAAPPAAARSGSNTALKVILIVVGAFVLLGVIGIGACFYGAYRFRKGMNQFAQSTPYHGVTNPCRLITQNEVSDALGSPVQAGEVRGRACAFEAAQPGGPNLSYDVAWQGGRMAMKILLMAMRTKDGAAALGGFTPVPGLGDEAYTGPAGSMFLMRKGDVLLTIDMRMAQLNVDAAKKIAAIIATRI